MCKCPVLKTEIYYIFLLKKKKIKGSLQGYSESLARVKNGLETVPCFF